MRLHNILILASIFLFSTGFLCSEQLLLSEGQATDLVDSEELAKRALEDARLIQLQSEEILESAYVEFDGHRVIFNRVSKHKSEPKQVLEEVSAESQSLAELDLVASSKLRETFILSGNVWEDGVSELWWDFSGERYRIFTNANCMLFRGIPEIETEAVLYSILSLLVERSSVLLHPQDEEVTDRFTISDFSQDHIEYAIIEPKSLIEGEKEAFLAIEALLGYYVENYQQMFVAYQNAETLRKAREKYLRENPPVREATWINFRPTGKSAERFNY